MKGEVKIMGKCKNCDCGIVDGGAKVRIARDLETLRDEMRKEIDSITEKNKDKRIKIINDVRDKFNKLFLTKEKEEPGRLSGCCRCNKGDR